jgi:sulfonate transport system substrate-binding protein
MKNRFIQPSALFIAAMAAATVHANESVKVIRISYPGVGLGGIPVVGGSTLAYIANKGLLEDEFKKDGIKVEWSYYLQAGPALNEAYANDLVDIGLLGDLPSIVGKASGLDSRIVLAGGRNVTSAVSVPTDSRIRSIEELKGKRVGIFKGTNIQVSADRILALHGLSEKDLKVVNLNGVAQQAALAARDIDAIFTSSGGAIVWEDAGIGKTIYRSDKDPKALNYGTNYSIIASQRFIDKHPDLVQRYVNVILKAAALQLDPKNRDEVFHEWSKSGTSVSSYKRDYVGKTFAREESPLLDNEFRQTYAVVAQDTKKYGLIRRDVDVDSWFDDKFLQQGLKDLHLESAWKAY